VWSLKGFLKLIGGLALLWIGVGILGSFVTAQGLAAPSGVEPNSFRLLEAVRAGSFYFCTGSTVLLLCAVVISGSAWRTSLRGELRYILGDETIPSTSIMQAQLHQTLDRLEEDDTMERH
jgi:hypothetical protein